MGLHVSANGPTMYLQILVLGLIIGGLVWCIRRG